MSPQQFGILFSNPKILFCMGEAGAGKTELFLAKALASALDPEVIRIYYCIPSKKEEKKTKLHMLVDDFRNRHACDFVEKFQIISYETLVDETFHQRMPKDLSKVVLLIDEFLYRYDQIFQASPKQLHTMCLKLGPYLKHFWLASLTLKWYSGIDIINKMYVPHEFFSGKPLNVQYRSAKHIGQLCTHLVHLDRLGRFSSSRVPGVFISGAQQEVRLEAFQQNLLQLEKPEKLELDSKYSQNRWIVAVCFTKNKSAWMNYIKRQFAGNEANQDVFTISMEDGPPGCNFSRGEIQSVVLFVDGPSKEEYEAEKDKYDDLMLLVCSRAQYELSIFVRDDLDHIFGTFDRCFKGQKEVLEKPSSSKSSLMIAEFLNDLETMIFSEEDVKQRFDKKEHKILIQILTNRDAKAIRFIILNLGVKLARNIFAVLLDDSSTDYGEELHPGFIFKSKLTHPQLILVSIWLWVRTSPSP